MKKAGVLKTLLCIMLAGMMLIQPFTGFRSEAASTKNLTALNYTESKHSMEAFNYPTNGFTTPGGKEYKKNIVFFDASLDDCHVTYNLGKKYSTLKGKLVTSTSTGSGVFNITFYGDNHHKLKEYKSITNNNFKSVNVNVSGVKNLTITAENTGSYGNGFVYFVESKLYPISYLKVSDKELSLDVGDITSIDCTYKNKNKNTKAKWSSSDTNVAIVSTKGMVKAVGTGLCTITCKYGGETKTVKVFVKPARVTGVTAKSKGKNFVQLTWKAQPKASGYMVYVYDEDFKEFTPIKNIKGGKTNTLRVTDLKRNKTYKFYVKAYSKFKNKTVYGEESKVYKVKTNK